MKKIYNKKYHPVFSVKKTYYTLSSIKDCPQLCWRGNGSGDRGSVEFIENIFQRERKKGVKIHIKQLTTNFENS